jgi:hypothetical protein
VNPKIIGIYGCEKPPKNGIFIGIDPYPYHWIGGRERGKIALKFML